VVNEALYTIFIMEDLKKENSDKITVAADKV
jgi:hypothetical protein